MLTAILTINTMVHGQEVSIVWHNNAATVSVSDDIQNMVKTTINGADVAVEQDTTLADEITYRLSGQSDNGSFRNIGSYKITLSMEGLQLTSKTGAAIEIKNGKRIAVVLKDGTDNSLTDAEGGDQKACMVVKGHAEFQGGGSLTINGRGKHAYKGDEYVELKPTLGAITINSAVKDGIHTDGYFEMNGGTLNITTAGGGYWDDEDMKTKAPLCINTAANAIISGGSLNLLSTGDGGKGINCDSTFTMNGGALTVRTTGARYIYDGYEGNSSDFDAIPDSLKNSPKAVKADMGICINGGTLRLFTEHGGGEGLESKDTLTVTGGDIRIESYDDCINAAGDIRIGGGDLYLSSFDNDGIDTNKSMYISGGYITTLGNYLHELGVDINDKSPNKNLYLTGGTIVSVGGTSQVPHPSGCDGAQPALYYEGKLDAGTPLLLHCTSDSSVVMRYLLQRDYTTEAGGTQPDMCIMLSSPLLQTGKAYELLNENSATILGSIPKLGKLYSNLETNNKSPLDDLFGSESFTYGSTTLPYRYAELNHTANSLPAIILNRLVTRVNTGQGKNVPVSIIVDELSTLYFHKIDRLIGTARSNKVSVTLGFQELPQLESDYGKVGMQKVITTVGNVVSGSARAKETLEWLSNDIFGKVVQLKKGVTIDRDKTSINLNENMDSLVPGSKIADMPTGWICGQTARDFIKTKTGRGGSMDI